MVGPVVVVDDESYFWAVAPPQVRFGQWANGGNRRLWTPKLRGLAGELSATPEPASPVVVWLWRFR